MKLRRPPVEKSTEPIVGFRVWNLIRESATLKSCAMGFTWPFRKRMERDEIQSKGIHAAKDAMQLCTGTANHIFGLWREYTADVAGSVYLWGEVTECAQGYLAEFAYPKQLWMPEDTDPTLVMRLEENYGVPVSLRAEFAKNNDEPNRTATAILQQQQQALYQLAARQQAQLSAHVMVRPPFVYGTYPVGY